MSDTRYPKRSGPGDYDSLVDTPRDAAEGGQTDDPLAELARLIDEDPFADFNQRRREPPLSADRTQDAEPPVETPAEPASAATVPDGPESYFDEAGRDLFEADDLDAAGIPQAGVAPGAAVPPSGEIDTGEPAAQAGLQADAGGTQPPRPRSYATPTYATPTYTTPRDASPAYEEPAYEEPSYEEPAYEEPGYEEPAREEPVFEEPAIEPPVYEASAEEARSPVASDELEQGASDYHPANDHEEPAGPAASEESAEDYDRDSTERLYADLAAASMRAEPSIVRSYPEESAATEASEQPAEAEAEFDPVASLEARMLAEEARQPVEDFDFGDLTGGSSVRSGQGEPADFAVPPRDDDYAKTDPVFDDSGHIPPYNGDVPVEATGRRRGTVVVAALIGLVVLGGLGAFAYRSLFGGDTDGPAPVIRADKSPSKVQPQPTGTEEAPQQGKLVYDRVGGDNASTDAKLVSREEPVADVGNRQVRVIDPNQEGSAGLRGSASDTDGSAAAPVEGADDLPKRVRTVVVKPDGTIVGEIEPPKPAEPLQPAPLQPAALPNANTDTAPAPTPVAPAPLTPAPLPAASPDTAPATAAAPDAAPDTASDPGTDTAADTASDTTADTPAIPLPKSRPADLPTSQPAPAQVASAPTQPAPARPAPAPANQPGSNFVPPSAPSANSGSGQPIQLQPVASAPATQPAPAAQPASAPATTTFPAGSYVVQVAASRSEQDAQSTAASITQRYSSVLSGYSPAVERADLGDRGIYYRVGVGPLRNQGDANSLCSKLKSAGLDCFVRRN